MSSSFFVVLERYFQIFNTYVAKFEICTIVYIGHMDDYRPDLDCGNSIDSRLRRDRELRTFPPYSNNKKLTHRDLSGHFCTKNW